MRFSIVDLGNLEYAYIVPIADLHIGDPAFDEPKLMHFLDWVENEPNVFMVLVGDLLNAATKNSVSDVYKETMPLNDQITYAIKTFSPLKHKIIGCVSGNHEYRAWKETGIDVMGIIAESLGVAYDMDSLMLDIKIGYNGSGRFNYTLFMMHGNGGGGTIGGKLNTVDRMRDLALADIYVSAHTHIPATFSDYYYVPDTSHNKLLKTKRLFVVAGSFLNWGGYAERKQLRPFKTGSVRIRIDGKRKDYHASV